MAGSGYFVQGLVDGFQQGQQFKMRKEFMNAQKKLFDAKIKAQEAKDGFFTAHPEYAKFQHLPPELAMLEMFTNSGLQGVEGGGQQIPGPEAVLDPQGTSEGPPGAFTGAEAGGGPPQAPGVPDLISRAIFSKTFGMDPGKRNQRSIAGPGGRPVTQNFDISGQPVGEGFPEAVTPIQIPFKDPVTGASGIRFVDPFTGQEVGQPGQGPQQQPTAPSRERISNGQDPFAQSGKPPGGGGIVTGPPEMITIEEELPTGEKIKYEVNEVTREPIPGTRRTTALPKGMSAEGIGKLQGAESGIAELNTLVSNLVNEDGTFNRTALFNLQGAGLPWSEGRTALQAWKRAMNGIVRPLTGAAITPDEWKDFKSQYLPSFFDESPGVDNKIAGMASFLNGVIHKADPSGKYMNQDLETVYDPKTRSIAVVPRGKATANDPLGLR